MVTHISRSPEDTRRLGKEAGRAAQAGDVIGLMGDLGAGKTEFVKGFALGLGLHDRIHSPTFALINQYLHGRLPCYHIDLYRLETAAQMLGAGLEEFICQRDGVTIVEWFDRWNSQPALPQPSHGIIVRITAISETERRLEYDDFGA